EDCFGKPGGGKKKATKRAPTVTDRDTQLGYRLGYSWSENGDFELEIGGFSAEGGIPSPHLPDPARGCLVNSRGPSQCLHQCPAMPAPASGLLQELLQKIGCVACEGSHADPRYRRAAISFGDY